MVSRVICALIACVPLPLSALDLTPRTGVREIEGISLPVVRFIDESRRVTWRPPPGWRYSGEKNELNLSAENNRQSVVRVNLVPKIAIDLTSVDGREALKAMALEAAPDGAISPTLVGETENPIILDRHGSYEATVEYGFGARRFKRSLILLPLQEHMLKFTITSRAADFEKFRGEFLASMYSWVWE